MSVLPTPLEPVSNNNHVLIAGGGGYITPTPFVLIEAIKSAPLK